MGLSATPITSVAGNSLFYPAGSGTAVASNDDKSLAQATANRFAMLATGTSFEVHDDTLASDFATWSLTTSYADAGGGGTPTTIDVPNLLVGDILVMSFTAIMGFATDASVSSHQAMMKLYTIDDVLGAAVGHDTNPHSIIQLPASTSYLASVVLPDVRHTVSNAGTTRVSLRAREINNNVDTLKCKSWRLSVIPMRP